MNEEKIASEIFQQYQMSFETATRAGGWTNAVWLNGDFALRLSFTQDSNRIRREVELAKMLPACVGYPANIATGVTQGHEWSLSKRILGVNLSEVWSRLTWPERTIAVRQIWETMHAVHTVDTVNAKELSSKKPWYCSFDADEALSHMENYVETGIFTPQQGSILSKMLRAFWNKLPAATLVLNHGDITMDNILWHNGEIVSLMDFEHSVIAPQQLDLNSFINLAFFDEDGNAYADDNNAEEFRQYRYEITNLLSPLLKQADCIDLLFGYAILFQQRFLDFWLENPEGTINQQRPYKNLVSLTDTNGSYLSQIINQ
jgi:aminoglycoside phosphotransferase (APT) family kinase protein